MKVYKFLFICYKIDHQFPCCLGFATKLTINSLCCLGVYYLNQRVLPWNHEALKQLVMQLGSYPIHRVTMNSGDFGFAIRYTMFHLQHKLFNIAL